MLTVSLDETGRPYCFCGCGGLMVEVEPERFMCPDWAFMHQVYKTLAEALRDELVMGDGTGSPLGLVSSLTSSESGPLWPLGSGLRIQRAGERRTADLREFRPAVDWDGALRKLSGSAAHQ